MTGRVVLLTFVSLVTGCSKGPAIDPGQAVAGSDSTHPPFEPPVVTNADSPVRYPPGLFQQNIEGTVMLRLFVDSLGRVASESTRVAEGSGVSGLDSAALAAVPNMKFAPARRNGRAVSTTFLQPIEFRRPERTGGDGQR